MTWDEASQYCIREHTALAHIQNMENASAMMNTQTAGYTDKAWIGLVNSSVWTWVDGKPATFFNWGYYQPDNDDLDDDLDTVDEACVTIDTFGSWSFDSCSLKKHFVCQDGN